LTELQLDAFPFSFERRKAGLPHFPVHEFVHGRWVFSTSNHSLFRLRLQEFVQRKDFSPKTMATVHRVTTQIREKR
jgi:hypothetical protein